MTNTNNDTDTTRTEKLKILTDDITKMLKHHNPFNGVYQIYGDHPSHDSIQKRLYYNEHERRDE